MFGFFFFLLRSAFRATFLAGLILWFVASPKIELSTVSQTAIAAFEDVSPTITEIKKLSHQVEDSEFFGKLLASSSDFENQMKRIASFYHSPK